MRVDHVFAPATPEGCEGLLAIVVYRDRHLDDHGYGKPPEGTLFITPKELSQQFGIICRPNNFVFPSHIHLEVSREVRNTRETLIVMKGELLARLFTSDGNWASNRILHEGDVIILVSGGHGFVALSDVELYEVKQGPYTEGHDKVLIKEDNPHVKSPTVSGAGEAVS